MKKFLSMLGALALSAALFVGCGPDATALDAAAKEVTALTTGLQTVMSDMDEATLAEFQQLNEDLVTISQEILNNPDEYNTQEKIDEVTKKYEDTSAAFKAIADKINYDYSAVLSE